MTGLRRDAGAGEKLFERDKFIALRAEHVDDLKCSICAGIIQIVQKNDVAGSDISIIWCATSSLLRTLQSIVSSVQKMRGTVTALLSASLAKPHGGRIQ